MFPKDQRWRHLRLRKSMNGGFVPRQIVDGTLVAAQGEKGSMGEHAAKVAFGDRTEKVVCWRLMPMIWILTAVLIVTLFINTADA